MNEQLVVKNFGPIKDATVDFKRVTVFIGPTGGGKSTLAKLAAIMKTETSFKDNERVSEKVSIDAFKKYAINNFILKETYFRYTNGLGNVEYKDERFDIFVALTKEHADTANDIGHKMQELTEQLNAAEHLAKEIEEAKRLVTSNPEHIDDNSLSTKTSELSLKRKALIKALESVREREVYFNTLYFKALVPSGCHYIPSERIFLSALEYSWAGLLRDDIGLPKLLLDFANSFSLSRKDVPELDIPFLNVKYLHIDGRDRITIPEREESLMLLETASGIQSVTPLLVLLEHLSRNTEQAQSFIIEEPELNLYPTAQQGLLNWLVEKCTKGENDLTITTHSPYILSSCNLLLEAYKVAQQRPELADEIDKIVPRACWLNPEEFAAYYVADGTVKPITDDRTHLIGSNELDAVSGDISDSFRKLLRLQKQQAV
ncbi:AAA family ATPase [Hymenobacter negativus]|uniref:AAA family ATPase n=1 Tax=Hymenobacter negativus TaxID=2795026 RepID=A0ABS3QNP4_9BACT|nr:AAA family ATPase [Hymenobacter negativus]MBO2012900.1 AAA family ATPase [Hymenobacter negativus]